MLYDDTPRILDIVRIRTFFNQVISFYYFELLILDNWLAEYGAVEVILRVIGERYVFERVPEIPDVSQDCI